MKIKIMKLKCIRPNPMINERGTISSGLGLVKNEIYYAEEGIILDKGDKCFFIHGLGLKLSKRFEKVKDDWADSILKELFKEKELCLN